MAYDSTYLGIGYNFICRKTAGKEHILVVKGDKLHLCPKDTAGCIHLVKSQIKSFLKQVVSAFPWACCRYLYTVFFLKEAFCSFIPLIIIIIAPGTGCQQSQNQNQCKQQSFLHGQTPLSPMPADVLPALRRIRLSS